MNWSIDGYPFGHHDGSTGITLTEAVTISPPGFTTSDQRIAGDDGITFGVDYTEGTALTFALNVVPDDDRPVDVKIAEFRTAWRGHSTRRSPGAVVELQAPSGRSTFGRGREVSDERSDEIFGVAPITASFVTVDDLFYGAEETASVGLVPPPSGGLRAPLRAPLRTTQVGERSTGFRVGGAEPTRHWRAVVSGGDILSPVVEVPGCFRFELLGLSLAYDQVLVIDARPWVRTVLRDGRSVAGKRSRRSTPLREAALTPGLHELVLRGQSTSGTARAELAWRPAFPTY